MELESRYSKFDFIFNRRFTDTCFAVTLALFLILVDQLKSKLRRFNACNTCRGRGTQVLESVSKMCLRYVGKAKAFQDLHGTITEVIGPTTKRKYRIAFENGIEAICPPNAFEVIATTSTEVEDENDQIEIISTNQSLPLSNANQNHQLNSLIKHPYYKHHAGTNRKVRLHCRLCKKCVTTYCYTCTDDRASSPKNIFALCMPMVGKSCYYDHLCEMGSISK